MKDIENEVKYLFVCRNFKFNHTPRFCSSLHKSADR